MNPLNLFFKKQYAIEEKVQRLLRILLDMTHLYQVAYDAFLDAKIDIFYQRNDELAKLEQEMDDLGRQIQMSLLKESIMPNSRDDLLWLLTKLDKVPSCYKHSLYDLGIEKPAIPETLHKHFRTVLTHTRFAVQALGNATDALFTDLRAVRQHSEEVSRQESEVDRVEDQLLKMVFSDPKLELARQYQLKGIILDLGGITDIAEDVADAVHLLATKHTD